MQTVFIDTIICSLKLLPILFLIFLFIEFIEHKTTEETKQKLIKSKKYGPFFGALIGAFPQCGFSAAATSLYVTRIISFGTLIAIYLSTSDEMLIILISTSASLELILKIIGLKVIIGMFYGFIIDFILRKKTIKD
jgi:hypothetical protein